MVRTGAPLSKGREAAPYVACRLPVLRCRSPGAAGSKRRRSSRAGVRRSAADQLQHSAGLQAPLVPGRGGPNAAMQIRGRGSSSRSNAAGLQAVAIVRQNYVNSRLPGSVSRFDLSTLQNSKKYKKKRKQENTKLQRRSVQRSARVFSTLKWTPPPT